MNLIDAMQNIAKVPMEATIKLEDNSTEVSRPFR